MMVLSVFAPVAAATPTETADTPGEEYAEPEPVTENEPPEYADYKDDRGCTMILVGKEASASDSVLMSRTEDYHGNWAKHLKHVPSETHPEGATFEAFNGLEWPLPEETYSYNSAQDWTTEWGLFEQFAINSQGVGVTATTTVSLNEDAEEADPLVEDGIHEASVVTLVAQRADTPEEGVELVGEIVEEEGVTQPFGMAIGDGTDVWYLETASGHHWAAHKIPDDEYFVGANAMVLGEVDLDSPNYKGSDDLVEFAAENDLYDPESEDFHLAKAYGTADDYASYNYMRVWGGLNHFGVADGPWDGDEVPGPDTRDYPLTAEPKEEITVKDVMDYTRYHYQDTEHNPLEADDPPRAVGTTSTIESHVLQLTDDEPTPISDVAWVSMGTPLASPYVPHYPALDEFPEPYTQGTDTYSEDSAFWQFKALSNLKFLGYDEIEPMVTDEIESFEDAALERQAEKEQTAAELWEEDETEAKEYLADYSESQAWEALELASDLETEIHTTIAQMEGWEIANPNVDAQPEEWAMPDDDEEDTGVDDADTETDETATENGADDETDDAADTTPVLGVGGLVALAAAFSVALLIIHRRNGKPGT
ncbi:C69 family dipeptidase [Natronobacterium gregoryi]|nr:C69 family dipeptidase [Natronobacterium gregoryi]